MTQIDFYTHAENKLHTACQILCKAFEQRARVYVATPDAALSDSLDRLLWSTPSIGFVPHCRANASVAPDTPIIIDHISESLPHDDVLLNLRNDSPAFFTKFQRLIEIVSLEEADRAAARERFKFYRDRGYPMRTHNLAQLGGRS